MTAPVTPPVPLDAAAFAQTIASATERDQAYIAIAAYNQMSVFSGVQDYDSMTSLVELMPEQWLTPDLRATWLLAGAHAAMHSTNPVMRRHRALMDRFSRSVVEPFLAEHPRLQPRRRARAKRAIGFLGSTLRLSAYAERGIRAVIAGLDRRRFEVHALALGSDDLPPAAALGADATHVLGDETAAQHHLRALALDAVIYMDGVSALMPWRLLARRIALKQFAWFHSHLTFGAIGMDGQIADVDLIPPAQRVWYAEPILDLPGRASCCSLVPHYAAAATPWRHNGWITFASFNRLTKISAACAAAWAEILHRLPTARLIIINELVHAPLQRSVVTAQLVAAGVPMDRVTFDGGQPEAEFLGLYGTVDLVLDTFPFVGGLTSFDGLGQGTPILTLEGPEFVQRQTASLLRSIDLPELITTSVAEYVATAVALAEAPEQLERLRLGLRERVARSPICDMDRLARDLSDLLTAHTQ